MDKRLQQLRIWLSDELGLTLSSIEPASADASFRRYFRAQTDQGIYVVMDAPPELEPCDSFVSICETLKAQGVHSPTIYKHSLEHGFLLLEDLGVTTFLEALSSPESQRNSADTLYESAIDALIKLQKGHIDLPEYPLPAYDENKLAQEMGLFAQWFAEKHLDFKFSVEQAAVWKSTKIRLQQACIEQPQVWVHRDYHSRNLMVTNQESPGVIDFQDMVVGPIGYDLASLFKDCYIEWPRTEQHRWLEAYRTRATQQLGLDFSLDQLIRWVDLCGLQRHLKVLGIFCRLHYRDDKPHYLADLPLVAKYVIDVLPFYPELEEFQQSFSAILTQAIQAR